jgi:hypothetical protein
MDTHSYEQDSIPFPFHLDEAGLHVKRTEATVIHGELADAMIDPSDPVLGHLHSDLQEALHGDSEAPADHIVSLSMEHVPGLMVYYGDIARQSRRRSGSSQIYGHYVTHLSRLIPTPSDTPLPASELSEVS